MQTVMSNMASRCPAHASTLQRDGCRQRAQSTLQAPAKAKSAQQSRQVSINPFMHVAGGLAAVQMAFTGVASAHQLPQQPLIVQEQQAAKPVADTAGLFDKLFSGGKKEQQASKQALTAPDANFNEKGGPSPSTPEAKELSQGYASGSDSLPVPDVGKDVDTSDFTKLNEKPEEGTLSAAGERSPIPGQS